MTIKQENALRAALCIITGIADDERGEGRIGMATRIEKQIMDALQDDHPAGCPGHTHGNES